MAADLGEGLVRNGLARDWQQYAKGSTTQLNVPLSMSVEGYGKADVEPWLYRVHIRASGTLANCSDVNAHPCDASICNLYSITTIIALFRAMNRYVGNDPPMPGVFRTSGGPRDEAEGTLSASTTGPYERHDEDRWSSIAMVLVSFAVALDAEASQAHTL
jgi:hypothetical protein